MPGRTVAEPLRDVRPCRGAEAHREQAGRGRGDPVRGDDVHLAGAVRLEVAVSVPSTYVSRVSAVVGGCGNWVRMESSKDTMETSPGTRTAGTTLTGVPVNGDGYLLTLRAGTGTTTGIRGTFADTEKHVPPKR
ncbi:hypothetical protein [Nonomuraea sp. NPDC049480]|uniref:hypothetical protein n=1 Tax=Nonomuraea sp. NPDC049480 TaxID=3364353 RepID=UPI00379C9560